MSVSKHRWIWVAAGIVLFSLLVAVNVLLIRWVRIRTVSANLPIGEVPAIDRGVATPTQALRPVFATIPALSFDEKEGGQENVDHIGHWDRNTWIRYNAVDFGPGISSVVAVLSCGRQFVGRVLSFHLDSQDGPVFAELPVPATKGFEFVTASAQGASGIHDVFITCNDGGFNLQSIKFIRPQFATNLIAATSYSAFSGIKEPRPGVVGNTDGGDWIKYDQINFGAGVSRVAMDLAIGAREAKIEFHLDSVEGPLIATLIPTATGDWNTFQIQECPAQSVTGLHDLYLTFHGGRGLPDLRSFQFKAVQ